MKLALLKFKRLDSILWYYFYRFISEYLKTAFIKNIIEANAFEEVAIMIILNFNLTLNLKEKNRRIIKNGISRKDVIVLITLLNFIIWLFHITIYLSAILVDLFSGSGGI